MSRRDTHSFENFVAESNADAPGFLLTHGLGISPGAMVYADPRNAVASEIDAVLDGVSELEECDRVSLRDLLSARIGGYLKEPSESGVTSMLDVVTLGLTEDASIKKFLAKQGVDIDQTEDLIYALKIFREAVEFFEEEIGRGKTKVNPELRSFRKADDIYELFKTAAGCGRRVLIPQACGILRIAAVIDFMERDLLISALPEAEARLQDIMRKHIRKNEARSFMFDSRVPGEEMLPLVNFELRLKIRRRIIAKLLHKPSNRTEEVLDHIGFRVTTYTPLDTLRLIYQLFFHPQRSILPPVNIFIDKSKNLLLDPRKILDIMGNPASANELVQSLSLPTIDHEELASTHGTEGDNLHSSKAYRAVHIVFNLPLITKEGRRIAFPIEIQILDRQTNERNLRDAPHEGYVERQMEAVRERVLGTNLETEFQARHEEVGAGRKKK